VVHTQEPAGREDYFFSVKTNQIRIWSQQGKKMNNFYLKFHSNPTRFESGAGRAKKRLFSIEIQYKTNQIQIWSRPGKKTIASYLKFN